MCEQSSWFSGRMLAVSGITCLCCTLALSDTTMTLWVSLVPREGCVAKVVAEFGC
jgi:hypothetical protein